MSRLFTFIACACLVSAAAGDAVLRSVPEIQRACAENRRYTPFELTGHVLLPSIGLRSAFTIQTEGGYLGLCDIRTNHSFQIHVGDRLRVRGHLERSRGNSRCNPNVYHIDILAHEQLPDPPFVPLSECIEGAFPARRIATRGVIKDVIPDDIDERFVFLVLESGQSSAFLVCHCTRDKIPAFRAFLGHEVVAIGLSNGDHGRLRNLGKTFSISGPDALRTVSDSTADPFDVPFLSTCMADDPRELAAGGRRKAVGTVLTRWQTGNLLLRTRDNAIVKAELASADMPGIGAVIETVGNPETDLLGISLARAIWRPTAEPNAKPSPPRDMTLRDIFIDRHGKRTSALHLYGETLRVTGTLKRILRDREGNPSLILAEGDYSLLVSGSVPEDLEEGCHIQATGVCAKESDVWRPAVVLPKIKGAFLVTRKPDDVVVLTPAPWWTPARFACVVAVLIGVIIAILIWNATLRVMVSRKSRALLREQAAKLEETLKIDERTRLAAELHDYLAQNLTVISYQVSAAESALAANSADAAECLKTADRMLLSCRADLRRCLWDLKSDALNEPEFAKAIARTSEPVSGDARLLVRFAVNRNRLSDSTAHAILSICRELVANAVRHGKVDKVQIAGELKDGALRFSVRDNGIGFDPMTRPGQTDGHFGLDGVAERIRRFNGQLQVDSTPGKGTRIVVTLRPKDSPT